jgi:hypothetical protein
MSTSDFASYDDPDFRARQAIDRGVASIVHREHGQEGFETRPIFEGAASTVSVPHTAAAISALRLLRNEVRLQFGSVVDRARGDGWGWHEIGQLLLDHEPDDRSFAEAAYEFVTSPMQQGTFDRAHTRWRCSTCGRGVTDFGPYERHPDDAERGHAPGCARYLAEVEDWQTWRELPEGVGGSRFDTWAAPRRAARRLPQSTPAGSQ